ncbi:hypothetical protein LZ30DRAFT_688385 [Colletotrichum cereale]|nr:hypothetical protein LZ30DRAFT_688385 [Colletotrichum cereale]
MRFSASACLFVLHGTASGLPNEIDARAPSDAPIDLYNRPDSSSSYRCGDNTYTGHEIYLAAQRGTNLYLAGERLGRNKYPHSFHNDDSKGNLLSFPTYCPADYSRFEFPLMKGSLYDGSKKDVRQGDERVVYYYEDGATSTDGHPLVYFCGILTHKGAPTGGFMLY